MNLRSVFLGAGLIAIATGTIGFAQTTPAGGPPTPPPPPLPNTVNRTPTPITTAPATTAPSPGPSATPSSRGRRGRGPSDQTSPAPGASPSETPAPPQFSSLDGVWEVQLQPLKGRTVYSHLVIVQSGNELAGTWNKDAKTKIPFTGSFDGRLFKLTLKNATTPETTLSGYEENFGDMVGIVDDGKTRTAFTASHRRKVKFNEEGPNIGLPGVGR